MALGLCCQWLELQRGKHKNILPSRALRLGRFNSGDYTQEQIQGVYQTNTETLLHVFRKHVVPNGIKSFRISSAMFPLSDKVDENLYKAECVTLPLKQVGDLAQEHGIRLTTHPGQFTVLSSDKRHVVLNSLQELNMQAWVFNQMGLPETPYYSINIHGGKGGRPDALVSGILELDPSARNRLTLENCEFAYSVQDLLPVSQATKVPICYDSHHHTFNTGGVGGWEAMEQAIATWPKGCKPNTHISNAKKEHRNADQRNLRRQHSDYLYQIPKHQLAAVNDGRVDMDVEAKMKNLAVFRATKTLKLKLAN
jgi:UV DNA damage endonuclease